MWGGAAVLRASGASLLAGGPTRGLTEQDPARLGASRLGLWVSPGGIRVGLWVPRRSLSYSSSWTPAARPLVVGPPGPGSESFHRTTPHPGGSSEATAMTFGHRRG